MQHRYTAVLVTGTLYCTHTHTHTRTRRRLYNIYRAHCVETKTLSRVTRSRLNDFSIKTDTPTRVNSTHRSLSTRWSYCVSDDASNNSLQYYNNHNRNNNKIIIYCAYEIRMSSVCVCVCVCSCLYNADGKGLRGTLTTFSFQISIIILFRTRCKEKFKFFNGLRKTSYYIRVTVFPVFSLNYYYNTIRRQNYRKLSNVRYVISD